MQKMEGEYYGKLCALLLALALVLSLTGGALASENLSVEEVIKQAEQMTNEELFKESH